jgi:SAM-dependent methyltransferase
MHKSSFEKMASFLRAYRESLPERESGKPRILEVGSKGYHGQRSYRDLIADTDYAYTGLDLEAGLHVDLVPKDVYLWAEIADNSFEVCLSGQTFEHNPFFWVTFAEMARVLVPGGYVCIIAPGGGFVHRYPYDCWRFYPDSWAALCAMTGLELVETYFEPDETASRVSGGHFRDSAVIARKPLLGGAELDAFNERLRAFVAPYTPQTTQFAPVIHKVGPAFADYESRAGTGVNGFLRSLRVMATPRVLRRIFSPRQPTQPGAH